MRNYRVIAFILGLGLAAIPASATIAYTSCSSGCTDTTGSYATLSTEPGASGLTFGSPITFVSGGLSGSGIYTDTGAGTGGTGTVFTVYNGSTASTGEIIGTNFASDASGNGSGIQIDLPANTYAFAMVIGDCANGVCANSVFNQAAVGQGTHSTAGATYTVTVSGSTVFFAIISSTDSPLTSLFLASGFSAGRLSINSFELGTQSGSSGGTGGDGDVPEPSTVFTLGGGFVGLFFWHRHRCRA